MKVTSLHDRFLRECPPMPPVPEGVQHASIQDLFSAMPWDDLWVDADMPSVVKYLRGNNSLDLGFWRQYFPAYLWKGPCISFNSLWHSFTKSSAGAENEFCMLLHENTRHFANRHDDCRSCPEIYILSINYFKTPLYFGWILFVYVMFRSDPQNTYKYVLNTYWVRTKFQPEKGTEKAEKGCKNPNGNTYYIRTMGCFWSSQFEGFLIGFRTTNPRILPFLSNFGAPAAFFFFQADPASSA